MCSIFTMQPISRRSFLTWLAATLPAAAFVRRAHAAAIDDLAASPRTMRALGEAVLPSELGASGTTAAVNAFQQWIAGYREHAELLHGYGTSKLSYAGPSSAMRWAEQLDQLDAIAKKLDGRAFADLSLARRRGIVRTELLALKAERIPALARASHVALALLAHFYASPDATDHCYESKISRQTCRPLGTSSRKPLPLAGTRA